jgi:hypothetical protein
MRLKYKFRDFLDSHIFSHHNIMELFCSNAQDILLLTGVEYHSFSITMSNKPFQRTVYKFHKL